MEKIIRAFNISNLKFNPDKSRVIAWSLTLIVLFIFLLQSLGILQFGKHPMNVNWPIYMLALLSGTVFLDYVSNFSSRGFRIIYYLILIFYICYGLFNAYGLNESILALNRLEHMLGSLMAISLIHFFFESTKFYRYFSKESIKLIFLLGVTNILVTLNEVFELLAQLILGEAIIKTPLDTPSDLLLNFIGFGLFFAIYFILKSQNKVIITK